MNGPKRRLTTDDHAGDSGEQFSPTHSLRPTVSAAVPSTAPLLYRDHRDDQGDCRGRQRPDDQRQRAP